MVMRTGWTALVLVALLGGLATAADWDILGSRVVNFRAERDTINVSKNETYRKIKLQVKGNGIRFYDLKIHFENGGVQDVPLRAHINKGGETRAIDLEGGKRRLEKIVFRYETRGRANRRATVILKARN